MNTAISDNVMDTIVKPILRRRSDSRVDGDNPLRDAHRVFNDDDGIIYDEARGDRRAIKTVIQA